MKLGLIAYADNSGLGSQTQAYHDHLAPFRTMVLDRSGSLKSSYECYPERYPDAWKFVLGLPDFNEVNDFLDGLDVVLMAECSPTEYLLRAAKARDVRTVIVPNWEYFHHFQKPGLISPDLWLAPSLWHFDEYPEPKAYLPFPVDLLPVDEAVDTVYNFVHIAGMPIAPDRNGTESVLRALEKITTNVNITIFCQKPAYIDEIMQKNDLKVPKNVQLSLRTSVKTTDELYAGQQVLLMPRRFGGLCLPVNEALARGMPVLMTDISPNNEWLPGSWLVPAKLIGERKMASMIKVYDADTDELAHMIDRLRNGRAYAWRLKQQAAHTAEKYSWGVWRDKYIETLSGMV